MLTDRDIQRINRDVYDIIDDYGIEITILNPKDSSQQPNWNKMMKEIDGDMQYDSYTITADLHYVNIEKLDANVGGDKFNGECILYISSIHENVQYINDQTIFILDASTNRKWRVGSIKTLQGQVTVHVIGM